MSLREDAISTILFPEQRAFLKGLYYMLIAAELKRNNLCKTLKLQTSLYILSFQITVFQWQQNQKNHHRLFWCCSPASDIITRCQDVRILALTTSCLYFLTSTPVCFSYYKRCFETESSLFYHPKTFCNCFILFLLWQISGSSAAAQGEGTGERNKRKIQEVL